MNILKYEDFKRFIDGYTVMSFGDDDGYGRLCLGFLSFVDLEFNRFICDGGNGWLCAELYTFARYPHPDYMDNPAHPPRFCSVVLYTPEGEEPPVPADTVDWSRDDIRAWRYAGLADGYKYPWDNS